MVKINPIIGGLMALLGITLLLTIIGVASPVWTLAGHSSWGLFRFCHRGECRNMNTQAMPDFYQASAAFGVMAILCQIGALGCFGFTFYKNKMPLKVAGTVLTGVAMIFIMICCAVFTGKYSGFATFGYSFYLSWVAFIFNVFATALAVVGAAYKIKE